VQRYFFSFFVSRSSEYSYLCLPPHSAKSPMAFFLFRAGPPGSPNSSPVFLMSFSWFISFFSCWKSFFFFFFFGAPPCRIQPVKLSIPHPSFLPSLRIQIPPFFFFMLFSVSLSLFFLTLRELFVFFLSSCCLFFAAIFFCTVPLHFRPCTSPCFLS